MAWTDQTAVLNTAAYRYIEFVGGRILQQAEVKALEDTQANKDLSAESILFPEGALMNASVAIEANSILHLTKATASGMKVYFNGSWELLPDLTMLYTNSGASTLYLHWVLWRVTADGTYQGQPGCLVDTSLVDAVTNEQVANRGQLQTGLTLDTSLSDEPLDPIRMIAKSTVAIPIASLTWINSQLTCMLANRIQPQMLANSTKPGFVTLTSDTSNGQAVASDDSRLSNPRTPTGFSVDDSKVADPGAVSGPSTAIGSFTYSGGISTGKLVYSTLRAKLTDMLDWLYTQVNSIVSTLGGYGSRITALEGKTGKGPDLSYHVGKPLDRTGNTHPPETTINPDGFIATSASLVSSIPDNTSKYGYRVKDHNGVSLGGVLENGDYRFDNPNLLSELANAGMPGISTLVDLLIHLNNSRGGSSVTSLGGDVVGDPANNMVTAIQHVAVAKTHADGSNAANGDVLTFQNGTIRPATPVTGVGTITTLDGDVTGPPTATTVSQLQGKDLDLSEISAGQAVGYDGQRLVGLTIASNPALSSTTTAGNPQSFMWRIIQIGNYKLAFGYGALIHGATLVFPPSWNTAYSIVVPSIGAMPTLAINSLQLLPPTAANGWKASFLVNGAPPAEPSNWWMYITVISISPLTA